MLLTFLASFTVCIFARCFSIWLTFVMHLWSRFSSVVWKIYRYFNVLHSLIFMSPLLTMRRSVPSRVGRAELSRRQLGDGTIRRGQLGAELAAPNCPIPRRTLTIFCNYCKKLNSLKHLVRTTVAELNN